MRIGVETEIQTPKPTIISPVTINICIERSRKKVFTSSLKIDILVLLFFPPALSVSPTQGFGSITFSFLRSAKDPILSQPFVSLPDPIVGGALSVSEKIASFWRPLLVAPPPNTRIRSWSLRISWCSWRKRIKLCSEGRSYSRKSGG